MLFCGSLPARAQNVTVGAGGRSNNNFPFVNYDGRYQQLYSASNFSSSIFIGALQFYGAFGFPGPFSISDGNYQISFSTTSATPGSLMWAHRSLHSSRAPLLAAA
jgi:hypothetical protein